MAEEAAVFAIELGGAFVSDLKGRTGGVPTIYEHAFPRACNRSFDENNSSLAIKLTSDDLREIDSAASKITIQG